MKKLLPILLVLSLVWWCGSCARPRVSFPEVAVPEETPECEVSKLLTELRRCEDDLKNPNGKRTNRLIRGARLSYLLGELSPNHEKLYYFEKGKAYGETLAGEQPAWAEGHYWLALNLCGLAEIGGARRGLKLVHEIVEKMEQALRVNPAYEQAGPHRVLGRIYYECPSWPLSVGNIHESLKHLSSAVALAPENSTNHLFLAETLLKLGKKAEARQKLENVLKATHHAHCPKYLEEDRQAALRLLQENWSGEALPGQARLP
jgi:tetratricopeptide (TPR) repeat protein